MENSNFLVENGCLIKYLGNDSVVYIPDEVTEEVHSDAFIDSPFIETVFIPKTTKSVKLWAFENSLRKLKEIIVDANNPHYSSIDGVIYNKEQTELLICPAGKSGSINVPHTVKTIESGAFQYCENIKEIHIPSSVENIWFDDYDFYLFNGVFVVDPDNPYYEFDGDILYKKFNNSRSEDKKDIVVYCRPSKEGEVILPESTFITGYGAFRGCDKITSIVFTARNSLSLGDETFAGCDSLQKIELPSDIVNFGNNDEYILNRIITLRVDNDNFIQYPDEVMRVLPLTNKVLFNFPKFLAISDDFYKLIIDENYRLLDLYYKEDSEYIRFEIEEDENGPIIGQFCISDDEPIFYSDINEYIRYFGPSDTDLVIPEHIIETIPFYDTFFPYEECLFNSVSIPKSLTEYYPGLKTKRFIVHKDNPNYVSINGDLYSKDGKTLVACAYKNKDECLEIPNGVTEIDNSALMYVFGGLIIPKTVIRIGDYFDQCSSVVMHVNKDLEIDLDGFDANTTNFKEIYFEMNEKEARENEFYRSYKETIKPENLGKTKLFCVKEGKYSDIK